MKALFRALALLALTAGTAQAQLPNIPDQSVWGRVGSPSADGGSGPSQPIPFSTLAQQLGTSQYLTHYAGASGDVQLFNAINSGATYIELNANSNFFNTTPIALPANFVINCNGYFIVQGASVAPSLFTMGESSRFINCHMNGNGTLFTGDMIGITSGNNQRLINVDILNTGGFNLNFSPNVGGNFSWIGGSFNRTCSAALAISSGTYNSSTGLVTLTMAAPVTFSASAPITAESLGGTGAFDSLRGPYIAVSASGTTVTYTAATGLGSASITSGFLLNCPGNINDAITFASSEAGTTGPRNFVDLNGNGSWGFNLNGGHFITIEGGSMQCMDFNNNANYFFLHNVRMACHGNPNILGTNGFIIGAIFDAALTIGPGAQNIKIEQLPGIAITDSSANATNQIIPAASNTYTQAMATGNTVGWQLTQAGSFAMSLGTNASNNPFIHSHNSLPLEIGSCVPTCTDYWNFAVDGGLNSIGVTGGDKGAGTINATGLYINGAALSASGSLTVGTSVINGGNANGMLYDNGGVLGNIVTANNGVLITGATGIPTIATALPSGLSIPGPGISNATITGTSSYNGNAWTTGTGTLTLGAGKTFTASNTLTLTGTDGSSVAFGTGGTVLYSPVANASLANSSLTIGSTNIALGATSTTLAGLTSVGATTFTGALTGHASLDLALTGGTMTGQTVMNVSGVPIILNSTSSAQNIQMQAAGTTTAFFGGATGAPLFVQNPSGINVVAFNYSGSAAAVAASPSFTAQATGNPVLFSAAGSDTNISITISPKGSGSVLNTSHVLATGTAPTISSCGGGTPSISGGDNFGTVVAGTGVLSSCVINFGQTWGTAPRCVASSGTAIASLTVTTSTTQLTIGGTSLTSDTINWVCGSTASNDNLPFYLRKKLA